ncbi:MAG: hypothetical protein H6633_28545 [Anaerolineales bacterium]|nr:hypothetical protein [Anaerolineales bacterium]
MSSQKRDWFYCWPHWGWGMLVGVALVVLFVRSSGDILAAPNLTLIGVVELEGRSDSSSATISAGEYFLQLTPDGVFEMNLEATDAYVMLIDAPGYLSAKAEDALPDGSTIDMGRITLLGGDVTGDDFINILDLALIASLYNTDDPQADINGDQQVNLIDLVMTATNYRRRGPMVIGLDAKLRQAITDAGLTPLESGPEPDPAKVILGQALFFDKELSGNRDVACSTCHLPLQHTSDGLSVSIGVGGLDGVGPKRRNAPDRMLHPRNSPDLFNRGRPELATMFWDIRVNGSKAGGFNSPAKEQLPGDDMDNILAVLAMFPVTARDEMRGMPDDFEKFGNELAPIDDEDFTAIWQALIDRVLAHEAYVMLFNKAYPDTPPEELGFQHAANGIAAFVSKAFAFTNSPWDRYLAGDETALTDEAKQGALLFLGQANCSRCHAGNLFTDQLTHNLAMPQVGPGNNKAQPGIDLGRAGETGDPADNYAFRTPPLRNVALTGPWTHAGAYTSLEAVVRHHLNPAQALHSYDPSQLRADLQGSFQSDESYLSAQLSHLDPLVATPVDLSDREFDQVIAFLHALTDPSAINLTNVVPKSVPSGLPVDK